MNHNNFNVNWVSPPGHTLKSILEKKNKSLESLANEISLSIIEINQLLIGILSIDENIASNLELSLGIPANFWIAREDRYRELKSELIESESNKWLKDLPVNDMVKRGWIESKSLINCLDFFEVSDIYEWKERYYSTYHELKFKKSSSFEGKFNNQIAWIRQGERICNEQNCDKWNKEGLEEILPELKKLTRLSKPQNFIPKLIHLCSKVGIAVTFLKTLPQCPVYGVTKFLSEDKAMILSSSRYLSDDHFWFTFFHEIGHLLLHSSDKQNEYMEGKDLGNENKKIEEEANLFSQEFLVPYTYENELRQLRSNTRKIVSLSSELGISPGILIGQMQKKNIIKYQYLNSFKRRYTWDDINSAIELANQ